MALRFALTAGLLTACSAPDLSGTNFSCNSDADCSGGKICGKIGNVPACVAPADAPIALGMTGPLSGPSLRLGTEMQRGILAYFKRVNDDGGVFGRRLELDCQDDQYDPSKAREKMKLLLDIQRDVQSPDLPDERGPNGVFAIIGNIGTPTMLETAPLATKNRVIYFAPFTGSQRYLRDGTNSPYVYNYRAGYYEETEAMVDYLSTYRQPRVITSPPGESYKRIIAFTQNDTYGDAGYNGLVQAYNRMSPLPQPDSTLPNPSIARLYYERENVASVDPAIVQATQLLEGILGDGSAAQSVAILMVDTYQPANKFIRSVKDWINADPTGTRANKLDVEFMNVSFVGSDSLAEALTNSPDSYTDVRDGKKRYYTEDVMVTQVVPSYASQAVGVTEYRADIQAAAGVYSFTSLEGYVAARLFVKALELNGPTLDTETFRTTLDTAVVNVDIGIGTRLNFSSTNHQASHTVWGSFIQPDGSFRVPFTWNPTDRIAPN
jgi:ABC-type branched-subunit amino acid transport system substrate-binding protein